MPRPSNRLRIIGGQWRSRVLDFPDAPGLRPTPDRVRETLFNWLGQDLSDASCLDLFAGSGALGFEALSRNAGQVAMVENAPAVYRALQDNAAKLGVEGLRLLRADALEFLRTDTARYEIVFLDPPYGSGMLERVWPLLDARLAPGAVVYAEDDKALEAPPGWRIRKSGRAGGVHFYLLEQAVDEK